MQIRWFMFHSKFSCGRYRNPKLAALKDFAEGCIKKDEIITDDSQITALKNLQCLKEVIKNQILLSIEKFPKHPLYETLTKDCSVIIQVSRFGFLSWTKLKGKLECWM